MSGTRARWVWPILGGGGKGGTPYGKTGPMWSSGRHTGLDFPVPSGTGVLVVAPGRVTYAGNSGGAYGNLVKVSHGGGLESWYAHLSRINVPKGMRLAGGEIIGAVGSTGNTTGPHLHLEARLNGAHVNPTPYLTTGADPGGSTAPQDPPGTGTPLRGGTGPRGTTAEPAGFVGDTVGLAQNYVVMCAALLGGVALILVGASRLAKPYTGQVRGQAETAAQFITPARAALAAEGATTAAKGTP